MNWAIEGIMPAKAKLPGLWTRKSCRELLQSARWISAGGVFELRKSNVAGSKFCIACVAPLTTGTKSSRASKEQPTPTFT